MAGGGGAGLQGPLLGATGAVSRHQDAAPRGRRSGRPWTALAIAAALLALAGALLLLTSSDSSPKLAGARRSRHEVESGSGAVAADDARCSEVGAAALRAGGHAVDAAVAAALCLGVVHPMSSGVGGGAFVVVRDAASGDAVAFDARETAPAAATPDMYAANPSAKYKGALAMGVPGELAGLHAAWSRYGRLPWRDLVAPAIRLARDGYEVVAYVARALEKSEADVLADPGLRAVFAPAGRVLAAGETCRNPALAGALERVAEEGAAALYGGAVGEALARDVAAAGGVVTAEDLRAYRVEVSDAMRVDALGFTFLGMPPPSSGTVGVAMILNILGGYKSLEFVKGFLGIHRLIEAIKHMLAIRMDLGDPDFVNVTGDVAEMLSTPFADRIRARIVDNTTFPPGYYLPKYMEAAGRPRHEPPVRGGRRPERGGDDDDGELLLRRQGAVAVDGHRAQRRDGRLLRPGGGARAGPPPARAGQLHRAGEAAAVIHDAARHAEGRPARRRRWRQRRHQHHRHRDAGVPQPLRRRHGPPRRRPAPQGLPQVDSKRGDVRERDGGRRRGDRAERRGEGVPGGEGPRAAEHGLGSRVPVHRARNGGAGGRRWRVPREAHRRQRPQEGRQPGGVVTCEARRLASWKLVVAPSISLRVCT